MKKLNSSFIKKIIISILLTIILNIFFWAAVNVDFFNPATATFNDVDLTDIITSKFRPDNYSEPDTNIVLINIAETRKGISEQIDLINSFNPKVIAIDALLEGKKTGEGDSLLIKSLSKVKYLVIGNRFNIQNKEIDDLLSIKNSVFMGGINIHFGFANLPAKNTSKTIRSYMPFVTVNDSKYNSFTTEILKIVDPSAYHFLLSRYNDEEIINYRGRNPCYKFDLKKDPLSIINNKIILIGYFQNGCISDSLDCTDKFYTPLNGRYIGRSLPDMYGVEIHANILAMTLNRDYISVVNPILQNILIIIIFFMNTYFLSYLLKKRMNYYGVVSKIFTLLEVLIVFVIYIFINIKFLMNLDIKFILIGLFFLPDFYEAMNKFFNFIEKEKL